MQPPFIILREKGDNMSDYADLIKEDEYIHYRFKHYLMYGLQQMPEYGPHPLPNLNGREKEIIDANKELFDYWNGRMQIPNKRAQYDLAAHHLQTFLNTEAYGNVNGLTGNSFFKDENIVFNRSVEELQKFLNEKVEKYKNLDQTYIKTALGKNTSQQSYIKKDNNKYTRAELNNILKDFETIIKLSSYSQMNVNKILELKAKRDSFEKAIRNIQKNNQFGKQESIKTIEDSISYLGNYFQDFKFDTSVLGGLEENFVGVLMYGRDTLIEKETEALIGNRHTKSTRVLSNDGYLKMIFNSDTPKIKYAKEQKKINKYINKKGVIPNKNDTSFSAWKEINTNVIQSGSQGTTDAIFEVELIKDKGLRDAIKFYLPSLKKLKMSIKNYSQINRVGLVANTTLYGLLSLTPSKFSAHYLNFAGGKNASGKGDNVDFNYFNNGLKYAFAIRGLLGVKNYSDTAITAQNYGDKKIGVNEFIVINHKSVSKASFKVFSVYKILDMLYKRQSIVDNIINMYGVPQSRGSLKNTFIGDTKDYNIEDAKKRVANLLLSLNAKKIGAVINYNYF